MPILSKHGMQETFSQEESRKYVIGSGNKLCEEATKGLKPKPVVTSRGLRVASDLLVLVKQKKQIINYT